MVVLNHWRLRFKGTEPREEYPQLYVSWLGHLFCPQLRIHRIGVDRGADLLSMMTPLWIQLPSVSRETGNLGNLQHSRESGRLHHTHSTAGMFQYENRKYRKSQLAQMVYT